MPKREEELEFISVTADDDSESMMNSALKPVQTEDSSVYDNVIGGWIFKQSKHPTTVFFHILFKSLALFFYIFGSWFTSSFIFTFVLCIIFLAFDFWVVKNVSGRLLVGLRWWSYVRDDGTNEWVFESLEDMAEISNLDSRIFWTTLYVNPVIWGFLLVIGLLRLKFEYMPVVIAAISMSMANIIGYMKCSTSAKTKMKNMMEQGLKNSSLAALDNSAIRNWIVSSLLTNESTSPRHSNNNSGNV